MESVGKNEIILIADPRILAVPVIENHEPWVDLRNQNTIAVGPSPEIENNTDYTQMRRSVYQKLLQAQNLLPSGLKFCLYEAYRSLPLQQQLFNHHYTDVKNHHPQLSDDDIFLETIKLVSPIMNLDGSKNIPPHATGAAIDVYLLDENNVAIEMGIHPKDWLSDYDGLLSQTRSFKISATAKKNRQIMCEVLEAVDFVNYGTEYWHWSYGDRYWAYHKNAPHALYHAREHL